MPEITVIEAARGAARQLQTSGASLENQGRTRGTHKSFFAIALNIGFFLCYFRRRVEFAGI
jgi:hypothetical protein